MADYFFFDRRVEFCETDAAGIAHFSSFMVYMEQAEHAFLRHCNLSVVDHLEDGWHLSWPRVHVECDYRGAARFEDVLEVRVCVGKLGQKSVTYEFQFFNNSQPIAQGRVVAVCCEVKAGEDLRPAQIPDHFKHALQPYHCHATAQDESS